MVARLALESSAYQLEFRKRISEAVVYRSRARVSRAPNSAWTISGPARKLADVGVSEDLPVGVTDLGGGLEVPPGDPVVGQGGGRVGELGRHDAVGLGVGRVQVADFVGELPYRLISGGEIYKLLPVDRLGVAVQEGRGHGVDDAVGALGLVLRDADEHDDRDEQG